MCTRRDLCELIGSFVSPCHVSLPSRRDASVVRERRDRELVGGAPTRRRRSRHRRNVRSLSTGASGAGGDDLYPTHSPCSLSEGRTTRLEGCGRVPPPASRPLGCEAQTLALILEEVPVVHPAIVLAVSF